MNIDQINEIRKGVSHLTTNFKLSNRTKQQISELLEDCDYVESKLLYNKELNKFTEF
jgi:hypothetical protein